MKKRLDVVLLAVLWSLIWVGMAPASEVLRVTTWGGNYQKSYDVTVGDFEKENKCKVEWIVGSSADFMVKARMAQADVVTTDLTNAIMGETEGLWAKLDESKIPNMKHLYENAKHSPYTVFANVGDYALVYNSKMVKKAPTSWNALWDPAFKNRVAIYYFGSTGCTSLMILQAVQRGGSVDRIDPGLQRMVQLAKSGNLIGMVEAETQLVSLFELQEAWIGMLGTGRIKGLWDKGADYIKIVRPEEGTFPMITTISVVKTAKSPDLAMKFVNHVLGPANQKIFAERNLYAPSVNNVKISDDFKYRPLLVTGEAFNKLFIPDLVKVGKYKGQWGERFNKMMTQ